MSSDSEYFQHLAISGDIFIIPTGEAKDANKHPRVHRNYVVQNISSAEVEETCPREWRIVPHPTENPWKTNWLAMKPVCYRFSV